MKVLDTTRLPYEQVKLLKIILDCVNDRMPVTMLGRRMRLSNLSQKPIRVLYGR